MAGKRLLGGLIAPLLLLFGSIAQAQVLPSPALPVSSTDWFQCWQLSTNGYRAKSCTASALATWLYAQPNDYTGLQIFSGDIALPNLTSHALLLSEGAGGLGSLQFDAGQLLIGQGLGQDPRAVVLSGDISIDATGRVTVTGLGGQTLGTFAFQNYATPPAIGGDTPNTGAFTSLSATSLAVNGPLSGSGFANLLAPYAPLASPTFTGTLTAPLVSTNTVAASGSGSFGSLVVNGLAGVVQCLQIDATGHVYGTGSTCGTDTSSFADLSSSGTLTANNVTATGNVSIKNTTLSDLTGSTQCLGVDSTGKIYGTGSICGNGSGGVATFDGRAGTIVLQASDVTSALGGTPLTSFASLASTDVVNALGFTPFSTAGGTVTGSVTLGSITGSNQCLTVSTSGLVSGTGNPCTSFNGRSGAVTLAASDLTGLLSSPGAIGATTPSTGSFTSLADAGNLSVGTNTAAASLGVAVNGPKASTRQVLWQTGGVTRWSAAANVTDETGANAGSDFMLSRFDDSGNLLDIPLTITRSTGKATFADALVVNGYTTLSGGTTAQGLTVTGNGAGSAFEYISRPAGQAGILDFQSVSADRWHVGVSGDAESGSNVGSNYQVQRYNDTGSLIDAPLSIARATGLATFADGLTVTAGGANITGNTTLSSLQVTGQHTALNTTASNWGANLSTVDFGVSGSLYVNNSNSAVGLATNTYNDGTVWRAKSGTQAASLFTVASSGVFAWNSAAAVAAGSAQGFSQTMSLDASGNLGVTGGVSASSVTASASFNITNGGSLNLSQGSTWNPGLWWGSNGIGIYNPGGSNSIDIRTGSNTSSLYYFIFGADGSLAVPGAVSMSSFTVTSDRRLKSDIKPLTGYGKLIDQTNEYSYLKNGRREWGVIAQEVQKTAPSLVHEGADEQKTLSVDYNGLLVATLAEVKELRARVARLEAAERAHHRPVVQRRPPHHHRLAA